MVTANHISLPAAGTHAPGPCIFNHDIASCTHEDVAGNYLYSGRALGLTEPGDRIQLHPFLKSQWPGIADHYQRIGLSHTTEAIWDISLATLANHADLEHSVFYFGRRENRVRQDHNWSKVVEQINCKNNFTTLASHLGMEVPTTRCFRGKQWVNSIASLPFPCYVKPAVSVAGKGIWRCEGVTEVVQSLACFDDNVPLQIQAEVGTDLFLNLQYQVTEQGLRRLLTTDQILDGFSHQGNRYPASYEPWSSVDPMAQWMYRRGMRGVFAFDVAVLREQGKVRFLPIECNPRYNGASYPTAVALKLGLDQWLAKDFKTRHQRIDEIDLAGIEFDPRRRQGVILVNWGTVLVGKLGVLIAGPRGIQAEFEAELRSRL